MDHNHGEWELDKCFFRMVILVFYTGQGDQLGVYVDPHCLAVVLPHFLTRTRCVLLHSHTFANTQEMVRGSGINVCHQDVDLNFFGFFVVDLLFLFSGGHTP
jgi:hypothetical protein